MLVLYGKQCQVFLCSHNINAQYAIITVTFFINLQGEKMKKSKVLIIRLFLFLTVSALTGCGIIDTVETTVDNVGSTVAATVETVKNKVFPPEETTAVETPDPEEAPDPAEASDLEESANDEEITEAEEDVPEEEIEITDDTTSADEWRTINHDYEVADGYQIRSTLTYSRIYKWDDERLASLWDEIGEGNPLPGLKNWGFVYYTGNVWMGDFGTTPYESPGKSVFTRANDMYYMVGTLSFENRTEGWDLSADRPVSTAGLIDVRKPNPIDPDLIVGRLFYSNEAVTRDSFLWFKAELTRNEWGPRPFIVGFVEYYAPEYPNGKYRTQYYENDKDRGYLYFESEKMEMRFADAAS